MAKPKLVERRLDMPTPDAFDQTTRLVERRLETPTHDSFGHTTRHTLPEALVGDQLRRLAVCSAIGAGLWTYGLAMETVVRPLTVGAPIMPSIVVLSVVAIAASMV